MGWIKLKIAAAGAVVALGAAPGVIVAENRQPAGPPDPIELLRTVAQARHEITSGEMELEVNHQRIKAVFDGEHRRLESFKREYSYVRGQDLAKAVETLLRQSELPIQ